MLELLKRPRLLSLLQMFQEDKANYRCRHLHQKILVCEKIRKISPHAVAQKLVTPASPHVNFKTLGSAAWCSHCCNLLNVSGICSMKLKTSGRLLDVGMRKSAVTLQSHGCIPSSQVTTQEGSLSDNQDQCQCKVSVYPVVFPC